MSDGPRERWTPAYDRMFDPDYHLAGDPTCRRWAWLDLCHMAAWKCRTRIIGSVVVPLKRGELVASLRFLADRWGWSVKKVRDFLEILEHPDIEKIETVRGTPKGTVYRVVNYDTYANPGHTEGHSKGHEVGTGWAQVGHNQGTKNNSVQQGTSRASGVERPRHDDDLSDWLNSHSDSIPDSPPLDDPTVRSTLYQHYGPPSMRASAWKRDDGTSVPTEERPKIFATALSGYVGMEGKKRIVPSEFDGLLRATHRRECPPDGDGGWLYDDTEPGAA